MKLAVKLCFLSILFLLAGIVHAEENFNFGFCDAKYDTTRNSEDNQACITYLRGTVKYLNFQVKDVTLSNGSARMGQPIRPYSIGQPISPGKELGQPPNPSIENPIDAVAGQPPNPSVEENALNYFGQPISPGIR